MISTTMHRVLANAADGFGVGLFARQDLARLVTEALDDTDSWEKCDCPLAAPLVVFFVVAMGLYRSLSIKNLLVQLLIWMRTAVPRLSLREVTPEAMCHARERLGVGPMKSLFEKVASRISAPASFLGFRAWCKGQRYVAVGAKPDVFKDEAVALMFQHSKGLPRRINKIAIQSLFKAGPRDLCPIDANLVDAVIKDIAQE